MIVKKCTCCEIYFPKTSEYFFVKKIKQQNKNGLSVYHSFRSICKKCYGKKGETNRIKNRCLEMGCSILEYRENWKKQYSKTRTKDLKLKKVLTESQYRNCLKLKISNPDTYLKRVEQSKTEANKRLSNLVKSKRILFTEKDKKNRLRFYAKNERERLTDSYIANVVMKRPVKSLTKELIETKRLIIKLKRHVKNGSK